MDIADSRRNADEEWKTSAPKFFFRILINEKPFQF